MTANTIASPQHATFPIPSSSRSSMSDLHAYDRGSISYDYGPQDDLSFAEDANHNRRLSVQSNWSTLTPKHNNQIGAGRNRTRARAASIGMMNVDTSKTMTPNMNEGVFGDEAYSYALRPEEDDEEFDQEGIELNDVAFSSSNGSNLEGAKRKGYLRNSFQSLTNQELSWMTASAFVVLGLSVTTLVLATLG